MSRKNDIFFIERRMYGYRFLVFAGGRVKVPLWLFWTTLGIIVGVIGLIELVLGIMDGSAAYGPPWRVTGIIVGVIGGLTVLYWAIVGLTYLVLEWRDALKGLQ